GTGRGRAEEETQTGVLLMGIASLKSRVKKLDGGGLGRFPYAPDECPASNGSGDPRYSRYITHFIRNGSYNPHINEEDLVQCELCGDHHVVETFMVVVIAGPDGKPMPIDSNYKPLPIDEHGNAKTHDEHGRRIDGWWGN